MEFTITPFLTGRELDIVNRATISREAGRLTGLNFVQPPPSSVNFLGQEPRSAKMWRLRANCCNVCYTLTAAFLSRLSSCNLFASWGCFIGSHIRSFILAVFEQSQGKEKIFNHIFTEKGSICGETQVSVICMIFEKCRALLRCQA